MPNSIRARVQPEVIVRLNSGLGNQLFQLAHGMSLAAESNARLTFDTTWFKLVSGIHPVKRKLRLSAFRTPLPEAFSGAARLTVGLLAAIFDKTRRGKFLLSRVGRMQVIQEHSRHPQPVIQQHLRRIYVNGYWQRNTPFLHVRETLLPLVEPKEPLSVEAQQIVTHTISEVTGFVHVRRGDYLHFMGEQGVLPVQYYSRALAKMKELDRRINKWLIFSDDPEWVRANLGFFPNTEIVDYQSANRDVEDLMVMKSCSAGIIANSSYSWWGAALGDRPDRPIVAPDNYWDNAAMETSRWALPAWHRVAAWRGK